MSNVIIIGGGAAGMMAAITAARNNNKVTLIEKNEKLGKKLFITGKGLSLIHILQHQKEHLRMVLLSAQLERLIIGGNNHEELYNYS